MGTHLSLAFQDNPESHMQALAAERAEIERALNQAAGEEQQLRQQLESLKAQLQMLSKILPLVGLLAEETLAERVEECRAQLDEAQEDEQFIRQFGATLTQLEPIAAALKSDPAKFEQLEAEYATQKAMQKQAQQKVFALSDVMQRRVHFGYHESISAEGSALTEQLRSQLTQAQQMREQAKEALRQAQAQFSQYNQVLTSLRSAYEAKNQMLEELIREIDDLGVRGDIGAEARARDRRDELQQRLSQKRLFR